MGKVISAHAVVFLEVADDGLDGGPPFEFALDLRLTPRRAMQAIPYYMWSSARTGYPSIQARGGP